MICKQGMYAYFLLGLTYIILLFQRPTKHKYDKTKKLATGTLILNRYFHEYKKIEAQDAKHLKTS